MNITILLCIIIFLYGIVIGSFLNVCIYRIPLKESIAKARSHCMSCGYQLKWYDLIPLFSYLFLRGKCRKCGQKISVQYPVIETLNGVVYVWIFLMCGWSIETLLFCLMSSALLVLSVIDLRTYEIPAGINLFILALGIIRVITDYQDWQIYVIGLFAVSLPLYAVYLLTKGRGVGGGDIKLMAACGLLIGWKEILFAFAMSCILGSVLHLIRMKFTKADHVLAMGPYLSLGVIFSALYGEQSIAWYTVFFL